MEFEDIYKKYYREVYYFIWAISQDEHIAEEVTQETFYKAFKHIGKYRKECSLKTWLCKIAKNTYLDWKRKEKHNSSYDEISDQDRLEDTSDSGKNPEEKIQEKQEVVSIYKKLHFLEEPYKEVFQLRVLGELSYREIGEIFEKSEGWARTTFYRARLKLKDLL